VLSYRAVSLDLEQGITQIVLSQDEIPGLGCNPFDCQHGTRRAYGAAAADQRLVLERDRLILHDTCEQVEVLQYVGSLDTQTGGDIWNAYERH
jgi:hypothetical protein